MTARSITASLWLFLCVALGGASAAGWLANGLLQALAILIILWLLWQPAPPLPRGASALLLIAGAFGLWALASLLPLPASIWSTLPGRAPVRDGFALLGIAPPSLPLSLDARRTVLSALSILPALASFLLALRLTREERAWVVKTLLGVVVVVVALGALQIFGGPQSSLRFYEVTIRERAVGTFANPNHMATLLLMALPFSAFLIGSASSRAKRKGGGGDKAPLWAVVAAFIAAGIAVNGSLAGYGLLIPAAACSFLVYRRAAGRFKPRDLAVAATAVIAFIGLSLAGPLNDQRFADELAEGPSGRKVSIPTTVDAAEGYWPIGSGLGTFRDVYRLFEDADDVSAVYVNHAHNDYVEFALEFGLAGVILLIALLAWLAIWTARAWRADFNGGNLARAASVALGLVVLHSLVDYPLRTATLASLAGLCCGYLLQPPASRRSARDGEQSPPAARHLSVD